MGKTKRPMAESRAAHEEIKTPHGGFPSAAGTYPNAWVELLLSLTGGTGDEHEKLRLPINLRVG